MLSIKGTTLKTLLVHESLVDVKEIKNLASSGRRNPRSSNSRSRDEASKTERKRKEPISVAMSEARRRFLRSLAPSKPESKPGLAASPSSQPVTGGTSAAASSKDLSVPVSSSSSSSKRDGGDTTRQRYIKMLGHDAEIPARGEDPETDLPPSKTAPGVRFTLEGLVAFCDTAEGIVRGKSAQESRPQARKRPNYNSTKRRFHAKVSDRAPFLGLAGRSFLRFCLQRVSTPNWPNQSHCTKLRFGQHGADQSRLARLTSRECRCPRKT